MRPPPRAAEACSNGIWRGVVLVEKVVVPLVLCGALARATNRVGTQTPQQFGAKHSRAVPI